jgi:hypothetical protein
MEYWQDSISSLAKSSEYQPIHQGLILAAVSPAGMERISKGWGKVQVTQTWLPKPREIRFMQSAPWNDGLDSYMEALWKERDDYTADSTRSRLQTGNAILCDVRGYITSQIQSLSNYKNATRRRQHDDKKRPNLPPLALGRDSIQVHPHFENLHTSQNQSPLQLFNPKSANVAAPKQNTDPMNRTTS